MKKLLHYIDLCRAPIPFVSIPLALLGNFVMATSQVEDVGLQPESLSSFIDVSSEYWPPFVTTTQATETNSSLTIKANTRGVLQRIEGNLLLVDFGRKGVQEISPEATDFYFEAQKLMSGQGNKPAPNLTAQIGNKLMYFRNAGAPQNLSLDDIKHTELFIIISSSSHYDSAFEIPLQHTASKWRERTPAEQKVTAVFLTPVRQYYDFAYTVGFDIPMIRPHMATGYYKSLALKPIEQMSISVADSNGKILNRFEVNPENIESVFSQVLEEFVKSTPQG